VVHDAIGGGQNEQAELTGGQQLSSPAREGLQSNVEARADDTALVQTTQQVNGDLAATVVINKFELANVACMSS
jgi:hypothetical protein